MVQLSRDSAKSGFQALAAPWALTALLLVALGALYAPLGTVCWREWWREESAYSHGILIPPLAALMIWQRRDQFADLTSRPAGSGLALVVLGLALQLGALWAHSTLISWTSFLIMAAGALAFLAGWPVAVRLAPPLLFLTFMVPVSAMLTQPVIFAAQMGSTAVAAATLRAVGFDVRQLGTILQLEHYTLQVALPCSGFKTLIALAAFAACFVYLLQGPLFKRVLLFGAALVLALLVNGLRIGLVGVTGELVSDTTAAWVHDHGGLPVTALALGGPFYWRGC